MKIGQRSFRRRAPSRLARDFRAYGYVKQQRNQLLIILMSMITKVLKSPLSVAKRIVNFGLLDTFHWLSSHIETSRRERRLGIDTTGFIESVDLGYAADAPGYDPISYACMDAALGHLIIDPNRDVFVDIGSGRGRPVIMAGLQPFRRVLGIELNRELYHDSLKQLERAKRHFRSPDVSIVHADATTFDYPPDMSVAFFWNPFIGEILEQVLEKIRLSHRQNPRRLTLIYAIPFSHPDTLQRKTWLVNRREISVKFWTGIRIFRYQVDSFRG